VRDRWATFDERARDWDTPERIARAVELAVAIRSAVPLTRTDRLIDIGSGTGLLGLALAEDVGSVVLADPSAGMIEVATGKLRDGAFPSTTAVRLDLVADPPPAEPFDVAVSSLVLHHIEDTAAALAAVRRLVRAGGWIALADLDTEDGTFHSPDAEGIHHHGFDRAELEALAREVGFDEVATRTAIVLDEDEGHVGGYPVFLLTGRRV
jgi:ubiquinone/menaquinone biosynthesis C-methylase UbiE